MRYHIRKQEDPIGDFIDADKIEIKDGGIVFSTADLPPHGFTGLWTIEYRITHIFPIQNYIVKRITDDLTITPK